MPTLRTLFSAPTSSPLAQIDVSNVAELMVLLTSDKHINTSQTAMRIKNNDDDTVGGEAINNRPRDRLFVIRLIIDLSHDVSLFRLIPSMAR